MRKLLFYIHSLGGGGAERVIARLATGFASRGVETLVAVEAAADENAGFLSPAVKVVQLGGSHMRATRGLARLLAAERPDVSISTLGVRNLKHVAAAAMAGRLDRTVLSYHGHFRAEPRPLDRLSNGLTAVTTRLAARTVCVSEWMRRHVVESLQGSAARTVVIHNPVSIDAAIAPADAVALMARQPLVVALGRLVPDKDFGMLIEAFARLRTPGAHLAILGEGPERATLAARAVALGIADRVKMPGYVPEPWAYFRQARVCAVSSRSESFSNVAVEALAHGVPVVSTDCGGPGEIISRPDQGVLTPVGDVGAFAAALETALASPGDPAPRLARARDFSLDRALDAYERVFCEVVGASRSPAAG